MRRIIIAIAAIGLLCSPVLAADKCETEIPDMIEKLKESNKIMDETKKKYIQRLEEALKHCHAGNEQDTEKEIRKLKDQFFHDALYEQQTFFGS